MAGDDVKILSVNLKNFASYKELDFTFDDQALTLIHGATGSGKSTLADAVPWALLGTTAKGGPVNDVLSWTSEEATVGEVLLEIDSNKHVQVRRTRGNQNDLWFNVFNPSYSSPHPKINAIRGKDLNDTQKQLNNLLGLTPELYLSAAYYHEFSQTAQFFTTTAKNRRSITEQLVDLSLPKKLQERVSEQLKANKQELIVIDNQLTLADNAMARIYKNIAWEEELALYFDDKLAERKRKLTLQYDYFESNKKKRLVLLQAEIEKLDSIVIKALDIHPLDILDLAPNLCKECGATKHTPEHQEYAQRLDKHKKTINDAEIAQREQRKLEKDIDHLLDDPNPYIDQLAALKNEVNYHAETTKKYKIEAEAELKKQTELEYNKNTILTNKADLETLEESIATFRALLIKNTILDLETQTNRLLYTHFDGEMRINLTIEDSDKLEVNILKDSNEASYSQLSKGQRCMLKLCFAVSVMKAVQNHHGISINQVWLDEALDGLDDNNKLKAVGLLEKLALEVGSVYFVEHSEGVKAMVDSKIKVELVNGQSQIEKA